MSEWKREKLGVHSHGFCPSCKRGVFLSEPPQWPELLKCAACGAEWCFIRGQIEAAKNKLIVSQPRGVANRTGGTADLGDDVEKVS